MKIKSIKIENFRSIKSEVVDCSSFNSFVGPNGSGKSTILNALNVFFGEINTFSIDDFHKRSTSNPIIISVIFDNMRDSALDEFKHYVRSGQLVVQVEINAEKDGSFKKSISGERLVFEPFIPFFDARSAKDRGEIFKNLRSEYPEIQNATNDEARKTAIAEYEESLDDNKKVLIKSGAEFFGVSKGIHKFQKHICWVYVPAVKEAASESEEAKSTHLGRLIQHTIRSGMDYDSDIEEIRTKALSDYQNLLDSQRRHLKDLESRLAARLKSTVTSDADLMLDWKKHEKSVSVQDPVAQVLLDDRGFAGEVDKFGHGLQRSFLLAILQELMAVDSDVSPTLILGCEEPELYQHPPQAKHLASVFMELSKGDSQVFITTHSPYFVDIDQYEGIKLVRKIDGEARIFTSSFSNIIEKYNKAFHKHLQNENQARTKLAIQIQPKFNEIFFSEKAVLVEGICDQACFESYLRLSGRYMDFQKSGASFIVCEGKSSVVLMLLIAKEFEIPFHVVIDCDSCSQADKHVEHIRDNDAIFRLCELDAVGKFPEDHVVLQNLTAWVNNIDDVFKEQLGDNRVKYEEEGLKTVGHLRSSKKNPLYIAASMKSAWEAGVRFPIFEKVVSNLLK